MDEDQVLTPIDGSTELADYALVNYYVNGSTGSDENDGLSPETPFLTVDKALTMSVLSANEYIIHLAAGTYTLTYTTARYAQAISIYGEDYEGDTPSVTIDGVYNAYVPYTVKNIQFNSGVRLYTLNSLYKECVFENCIFSYGTVNSTCVYCFSSSSLDKKTFKNCKFIGGSASSYMYAVRYAQNSTFDNCTFNSDVTTNYAISLTAIGNYYLYPSITFKNMYIPSNTFYSNSTYSFSKLIFDNCTFQSTTSVTRAITSNYYNIPPSIKITNSSTFTSYNTIFTALNSYYNNSLTAGLTYAMQTNNHSVINGRIYSPTNGTMYSLKTLNDEEYVTVTCDKIVYGSYNGSSPMMRFYVDNLNPKKITFKVLNSTGFSDVYRLSFAILRGDEYICDSILKEQNYIGRTATVNGDNIELTFTPDKIGDHYIVFNSDRSLPMSTQYSYSFDVSKIVVEEV